MMGGVPRQSMIVSYPMILGPAGSWSTRIGDHRGPIKFYLDFPSGVRFPIPDYGHDLDLLEQAGVELDWILPTQLFQLRADLEKFISMIRVSGVAVLKRPGMEPHRSLVVVVSFTQPNVSEVRHEAFETELLWQS